MRPILWSKATTKSVSWNKYCVFDWSNVVHRAAAVVEANNFIRMLITMLHGYRKKFPGWTFLFALDSRAGTASRRVLMPCYKANRVKLEEFEEHERSSLKLLSFMDCLVAKAYDGEADDVVASFVQQQPRGTRIVVVSEDRDLWQLISPTTTAWARSGQEITIELCIKGLGIPPQHVPLLKALLGDKSDNIPRGVAKIKRSLLLRVAKESSTPQEAVEVVKASTWMTEQDKARIKESWSQVVQNYSVVKLRKDLKLELETNRCDIVGLERFLATNGCYGLGKELLNLVAAQEK